MGHYLEIKNLKVSFRSYEGLKRILDIDELYIDKGEAYGLVGESGSGKRIARVAAGETARCRIH